MGVLTGDSVRTRLYHQGHANTQQKILEGEKILEGAAPWGPAVVTGHGWVLRFIPYQFFYHVGKSGAGSLNWSKNSEKLEFSCEWWVPDLRQGSYFGKVIPWHKQKQYTNKCVFHSPCLPNAQLHCNRKVSAAPIKTKLPFILFLYLFILKHSIYPRLALNFVLGKNDLEFLILYLHFPCAAITNVRHYAYWIQSMLGTHPC